MNFSFVPEHFGTNENHQACLRQAVSRLIIKAGDVYEYMTYDHDRLLNALPGTMSLEYSLAPLFFLSLARPYGIKYHMEAKLIYRGKFIYADGATREMVLWQLPRKAAEKSYGLKYRLYYGLPDGTCIVRYDNEAGKGHHKHRGSQEEPYEFKDVETLVTDFLEDIEKARRG